MGRIGNRYSKTLCIARATLHILAVFCSILFFPISWLLKLLGIRVFVSGTAIGHFTIEPETYLKEQRLGRIPKYKSILFPPFKPVISRHPWKLNTCNDYLTHLWKQRFWVITNPLIAFLLYPILGGPYLKKPLFFRKHWLFHQNQYWELKAGNRLFDIQAEYYKKFPTFSPAESMLKIPTADEEKGRKVLSQWGIGKEDWFVCFYAREPGFYDFRDAQVQGLRYADIDTYHLALQEISQRGGWCIRMGSPNTKPLSTKLSQIPRIIDYPHTEFVSPFMDVFLSAKCRFFLGGASGITLLPGLFGNPSVVANLVPVNVLPPYPNDIGILKLHYSQKKKRLLTFPEIYKTRLGMSHENRDFEKAQIDLIDNTDEEIHEAVKEMLDRLENRFIESDHHPQLQKRFMDRIPSEAWSKNCCARIGAHFLNKYADLF